MRKATARIGSGGGGSIGSTPPDPQSTHSMADKILFVDDEPILLQGYQRLLRKEFPISSAMGGAAGLLMVRHEGPFAVVISDMRMPEMNGVEFLSKVREAAPD